MPWTKCNPIVIEIKGLTDEIVKWYRSVGGKIYKDEHWDYKGRKIDVYFVGYGNGKYCHHRQDGTVGVRLHFNEEDAQIASLFIMTFTDMIQYHNMSKVHFE